MFGRNNPQDGVRRGSGIGVFLVYLIIGLYLINIPFQFLQIPKNISNFIDRWVILLGGVLTILGGINHMRARR